MSFNALIKTSSIVYQFHIINIFNFACKCYITNTFHIICKSLIIRQNQENISTNIKLNHIKHRPPSNHSGIQKNVKVKNDLRSYDISLETSKNISRAKKILADVTLEMDVHSRGNGTTDTLC